LVDAGKPVPWSKPEDLAYDPDKPLPDLQGIFNDGFYACMVSGARRWVKKETSEATLRALITRNGGDQPGADWQMGASPTPPAFRYDCSMIKTTKRRKEGRWQQRES